MSRASTSTNASAPTGLGRQLPALHDTDQLKAAKLGFILMTGIRPMRGVIFIVAVAVLNIIPRWAVAQPLTSTELIAVCGGYLGTVDAQCWSYLLGIIDGLTVGQSRTGIRFICSRREITGIEARLIFLKWASEHPASLDPYAGYAVATSLEAAFPCPRR